MALGLNRAGNHPGAGAFVGRDAAVATALRRIRRAHLQNRDDAAHGAGSLGGGHGVAAPARR